MLTSRWTPPGRNCPALGSVIDPGVDRVFGDDGLVSDDLTANGCTNPIAGPADVIPHGDWKVAVTGTEAGTVSPVDLHEVEFTVTLSSGACTCDILGDIDGTFDIVTQAFTPTESSLKVAVRPAPSGPLCEWFGYVSGVHVRIDNDASWTNVPRREAST